MKKYTLASMIPGAEEIPILDGAVFVFVFSRAALKRFWQGEITLTFVPDQRLFVRQFCVSIYERARLIATKYLPLRIGEATFWTNYHFKDTNIVVKMEKSRTGCSIYVDGTLCHTSSNQVIVSGVALRAYLQPGEQDTGLGATLLVFDETECGDAEMFAQAVQNGNMEDEANKDGSAVTDPRELALDAKEKALEQRELAILKSEKIMVDREGVLDAKEKALDRRLAELNINADGVDGGGNVANSDGSDPRQAFDLEGEPPDADAIRLSATQAWPNAVKYVLKSSGYTPVKTRHDILMKEWLEARGNNILPNSYHYFVFSLGVVWPKAVRELTTDSNLAKIREKQDEYMDLLESVAQWHTNTPLP